MTKQNSSKKHSREGPSTGPKKPSFKPKKMGAEIDDIFAAKKRNRPEKDKKVNGDKPVKASITNVISRDRIRIPKNGRNNENGTSSQSRKKTADGLTIYTEEELGIGKSEAGGTPLCPFDCECCF